MTGTGLRVFLLGREKIEKQSRKAGILELACYCLIPPTESAAATAVGEKHDPGGICGEGEIRFEGYPIKWYPREALFHSFSLSVLHLLLLSTLVKVTRDRFRGAHPAPTGPSAPKARRRESRRSEKWRRTGVAVVLESSGSIALSQGDR